MVFICRVRSGRGTVVTARHYGRHYVVYPRPPVLRRGSGAPFGLGLVSLFSGRARRVNVANKRPALVKSGLFILVGRVGGRLPGATVDVLSGKIGFTSGRCTVGLTGYQRRSLRVSVPLFSSVTRRRGHVINTGAFCGAIRKLCGLTLFRREVKVEVIIRGRACGQLPRFTSCVCRGFPFITRITFVRVRAAKLTGRGFSRL